MINDGKFCSSASGCSVSFFLRFLVGVQRAARNDQENLAALAILSGLYARARTERGAADGPARAALKPPRRQMVLSIVTAIADPFAISVRGGDWDGARAVGRDDDRR